MRLTSSNRSTSILSALRRSLRPISRISIGKFRRHLSEQEMGTPICANPLLRRLLNALPVAILVAPFVGFGQPAAPPSQVVVTVVDENGVGVSRARVTIAEPNLAPLQLWTNYAGHCTFTLPQNPQPYRLTVEKPGFYQSSQTAISPDLGALNVIIAHEQMVKEEVNVTSSTPGIDTQQVSNAQIMSMPEIVNIPYQPSRDIRYLLSFNPGVVPGVPSASTQVHVAGADSWQTLYMLDGFDIRSPVSGDLSLRVSADAVRSIDTESTRYPVEYGRTTGGVVALYTGMGDNKFQFTGTDFLPSFHQIGGKLRFDKIVPRFNFSGPLVRNHAWFFDGIDFNYSDIYVTGLPSNAATTTEVRGSNLFKVQANLSPENILTTGLLFDDFHEPYYGLSAITPQVSTTNQDSIAWFPYLRDQWTFAKGALLDVGVADMRFRQGNEPHGSTPYVITPEVTEGSYFENRTRRSQRTEGTATLYLPSRHWAGVHDLQAGIDLDYTGVNENVARAPVSYLREGSAPGVNGTLLRYSVFTPVAPFGLHNLSIGSYFQDRWSTKQGLLLQPGIRFDWNEIVRRPEFSPRFAFIYSPPRHANSTKISAGIGVYYDRTQLAYLASALAGLRTDTFYNSDGLTPAGPTQATEFTADYSSLRDPHALNWSVGIEQKLPGTIYAGLNFMQKRTSNIFTYANQSDPSALSGNYLLTNARTDRYTQVEIQARHTFSDGFALFGAYTRSSARTNAAIAYLPTPSPWGPQQSGPVAWDTPNRILSWGWLPVPLPRFRKKWRFVYTEEWQNGYPITSVDSSQQVVGAVGSHSFPNFTNFSPGLAWRFHFRGEYWELRGVMENALDSSNPAVVNNVVDSPQYLTFSYDEGRAFTARIRLIGTRNKKH